MVAFLEIVRLQVVTACSRTGPLSVRSAVRLQVVAATFRAGPLSVQR